MKLSKKLTTVTPLSKFLAMAFFIILPFVGFYLGIKYQELNYAANTGSQYQNQITQKQAEEIVKNLPEVKNFVKQIGNYKLFINTWEENTSWIIQIGDVIKYPGVTDPELSGHDNTFNWYKIDKNTGKVLCSMLPYDKNGNLVANKKPINCSL